MEKCSTSQWEKWEPCSSACAEGSRIRRRTLANPGILESMCNVNLMQKEACIGKCIPRQKNRHKISTNFVMRHDVGRDSEDACAVTGWSDWSPCSETCELGVIERSRMFLHRYVHVIGEKKLIALSMSVDIKNKKIFCFDTITYITLFLCRKRE